jgi:hypothetical protein
MQAISSELTAILKSHFQAGGSGFSGYARINGVNYRCKRISRDRSLRTQTDNFEIELENENLSLGWGVTSVFRTNQRVRIYQWYGDRATSRVRSFDGIIDSVRDGRDLPTVTITGSDRFGLAVDQTFSASAPQGVGETGAVRTEANGVFLNREASYIVNAALDAVGWPTADRDILATSLVLTEYIWNDGSSYADLLIGTEAITGMTGYDLWSDELGIAHFRPTPSSDLIETQAVPVYTWRTGEDVLDLGDTSDQYELITRVKTRGEIATVTLTDAWHLLWQTKKVPAPVGIWYDPAVTTQIRVISSTTKKLYVVRDSDHQVLSSVYLGGVVPHPLGISGDPADSTHYYVLNCPWKYTGSTTGNYVAKMRKSDNARVATMSLPDGRWSAIKISAAFMWLTNLDTDRFYKRDKTDASAIANYSHTYHSVTQTNPSGLMIDGTTLHLFWANGGTTARFLECDESTPTVIDKAVATSGSTLHGGEMNTTTHTECWGDNDSLGLTAKFSLVSPVPGSQVVAAEIIDTALEDELGANAELEDRIHDAHPLVAAHPWESRRLSMDLSKIDNLAQAGDIARFQLDRLGRRRRVVDVGIPGNPAVQKNDLVRLEDPKTGVFQNFVIDSARDDMVPGEGGSYLGVVSLVRGGVANDEITEPDPPPADPPPIVSEPSVVQTTCGLSLGAVIPVIFDDPVSTGHMVVVGIVWRDGITDLTSVEAVPSGAHVAFTEIGRTTIHGNANQETVLAYRLVTSADNGSTEYVFGAGAGSGRPRALAWELEGYAAPDAHVSVTNNAGAITFPSLTASGDGIAIGVIGLGVDCLATLTVPPSVDHIYIENADSFWQCIAGWDAVLGGGSVTYGPLSGTACGGAGGDDTNSGTVAFFPTA